MPVPLPGLGICQFLGTPSRDFYFIYPYFAMNINSIQILVLVLVFVNTKYHPDFSSYFVSNFLWTWRCSLGKVPFCKPRSYRLSFINPSGFIAEGPPKTLHPPDRSRNHWQCFRKFLMCFIRLIDFKKKIHAHIFLWTKFCCI